MELLKQTLEAIKPADENAKRKAAERLDNLAKPIGALGVLEEIVIKMAGITGKPHNKIEKRNVVVMCGDNGVVEEGVSACPQIFTKILTENLGKGATGISVLSKTANADITPVDIGVNAEIDSPKIINKKVMYGTKNMTKGPAMTREEAIKAIEVGIEIADKLYGESYDILGTGEMGIGNTTTSAAVLSAFSGLSPEITCGKGAGLTDDKYKSKIDAVVKALEVNKPNKEDPLDVISKVEIIHPIINKYGIGIQDGSTEEMLDMIKRANSIGKGIYGMKPLGGGHLISKAEECFNFVREIPYIHSIAIGMQSRDEVDADVNLMEYGYIPDEIKAKLKKID